MAQKPSNNVSQSSNNSGSNRWKNPKSLLQNWRSSSNNGSDRDSPPQKKKKLVLFLGGSHKKHKYLSEYFTKYYNNSNNNHSITSISGCHNSSHIHNSKGNKTTETNQIYFEAMRTKQCHQYSPHILSAYLHRKQFKVVACISLMDSLIPFQDTINNIWGLPGNDLISSQLRRNKTAMHKAIAETCVLQSPPPLPPKSHNKIESTISNGRRPLRLSSPRQSSAHKAEPNNLRYARSFEVSEIPQNSESFASEMTLNRLSYPVVVKPPASAGTEMVRLVDNFTGLKQVVKSYLGKPNLEHGSNESLLIQEYLDGEEYVINAVTLNGQHRVTDMWRAAKSIYADTDFPIEPVAMETEENESKTQPIAQSTISHDEHKDAADNYVRCFAYDYQQLIVRPNSLKHRQIIRYALQILDVLKVEHGCSHTEVVYLPRENHTCLIELNARMHGDLPRSTSIIGYDQLTSLALSHMKPSKFLALPTIYRDCISTIETTTTTTTTTAIAQQQPSALLSVKTVRAIFLRSLRHGYINFNQLCAISQLNTFKSFARRLHNALEHYLQLDELALYVLKEKQKIMAAKKLHNTNAAIAPINPQLSTIGGGLGNPHSTVSNPIGTATHDDNTDSDPIHTNTAEAEAMATTVNNGINMSNGEDTIMSSAEFECEEKFLTFESVYKECLLDMKHSYCVHKTIDLLTSPGCVILEGSILDIQSDTDRIRQLEMTLGSNGLYEYC